MSSPSARLRTPLRSPRLETTCRESRPMNAASARGSSFRPRAIIALIVVAATVLAAARGDAAGTAPMPPAHELGTTAPRIVNGTLTSLYPSVGALLSPGDPHTAGLLCSGTLIGCQTF